MLVIRVELWPFGDAEKAESLGILAISNKGRIYEDKYPQYYNYDVELHEPGKMKSRRAAVSHCRKEGWQVLVRKALEVIHGA